MTVSDLIELLDGVNPDYQVKLDNNFNIEDSFVTDPITRTIYLETSPEYVKNRNSAAWTIPCYAKEF